MNTTQSRTLKPSHLKPPMHSHSAIPKFSSTTRQVDRSDAYKENESPSRGKELPITKRVSPQKSPSISSQPRLSSSRRPTPPPVPDMKQFVGSFDGSSITRSASDHSRFDGESVMSLDTAATRSTDGGNRSLSSSRSNLTTGGGAKIVRPPNAQSRFDVTLAKSSSSNSLPKPPAVKSTSSVRSISSTNSSRSGFKTVGGDPLNTLHAAFEAAKPSPSSNQSSPSIKSYRSGASSIVNSPNRESAAAQRRFSPAREAPVSRSRGPSPVTLDRRKPPTSARSSPAKHEQPESMTSMVHHINENMAAIDNYMAQAAKNSEYYDLFQDDNLPFVKKWEKETEKIGGLEVSEFLRYCNGEDLLSLILNDEEGKYHGKTLDELRFADLEELLVPESEL